MSASPSAHGRHWKELMAITGRELNLAEDVFKLQHLLDANLLARRSVTAVGLGRCSCVGSAG
jgi:hypothetical protein